MILVLLVAIGVTILLQWNTMLEIRRDREKKERLDQLRERGCAQVYNGWVQGTYSDFIREFAKTHGLDYFAVMAVMPKLTPLKPDDIGIEPWDTPDDFVRRGRAGEIVWQAHPDSEDAVTAIKRIEAANTERTS